MAPLPRRLGRYELIREIGSGGMGRVYEAVLHGPSGFRKRVAVKQLLRAPDRELALAQEARLGALLSHPNIVATWELDEADGCWLFAMELVDGPSLARLRERGPFPAGVVADVGAQVAGALRHVHELRIEGRAVGLVHRDVKPTNLLVDPAGVVKLADLGIAALATGSAEQPPEWVLGAGTLGFAAPEQLAGRAEPRSDLFALGVVLAWLATGEVAFGHGAGAAAAVTTPEATLRGSGLVARVDAAVPGLGPIVERCLRGDPQERWPSAAALGDALRELRGRCPPGDDLATLVALRFPREVHPVEDPFAGSPTWRTAPTGIPVTGRPLIGRDRELGALRAGAVAVSAVRGPPGVGKSRLVAELVRRDGGWHVQVDEARTVADLCAAAGAALGFSTPGGDPVDQLGTAMACGPGPLVLDGVDRVAGAELDAVLRRWRLLAPEVGVILVARRRVPADRELLLAPLDPADAQDLLLACDDEGVLALADPAEVAALVRALDGLPLAIELAAAQASRVPVGELAASLSRREDGALRAALSRSWELLDAPQKSALSQLTTFAGGWDRGGAQGVLDVGDRWAIEILEGLVDHSLIHLDPVTGRFRLLGPVHAFAAQHLDDALRRRTERRHGEYYARMLALCDPLRVQPDQGDELTVLRADWENLTAATQRAIERGDGPVAGACAIALCAGASTTAVLAAVRALVEDLLQHAPALSPLREPEVRAAVGRLCGTLGDPTAALRHLARALDVARAGGDRAAEALAELEFGNLLAEVGDPAGGAVALEAAATASEALGHRRLAARATGDLGMVLRRLGRTGEAEQLMMRALVLHREQGAVRAEIGVLNNLANLRAQQGDREASRALYVTALERVERTGDASFAAMVYSNLAVAEGLFGRIRTMVSHLQRVVRLQREHGSVPLQICALGNLGAVLVERGDLAGAREVLEEGVRLAQPPGLAAYGTVAVGNLGLLALLGGDMRSAWALVEQAVRGEQDAGDVHGEMVMRLALASVARRRRGPGDLDRALAETDAAVRSAEGHGHGALAAMARLHRGLSRLALGDLERAEADLVAALPQLPAIEVIEARAALLRVRRPPDALGRLEALRAEARELGLLPEAPLFAWLGEVRAALSP